MKGVGIGWGAKSPDPLFVMDNPAEFWLGRVVTTIGEPKKIGHIAGFTVNSFNEVLPKIAWHDGTETPMHPANIYLTE